MDNIINRNRSSATSSCSQCYFSAVCSLQVEDHNEGEVEKSSSHDVTDYTDWTFESKFVQHLLIKCYRHCTVTPVLRYLKYDLCYFVDPSLEASVSAPSLSYAPEPEVTPVPSHQDYGHGHNMHNNSRLGAQEHSVINMITAPDTITISKGTRASCTECTCQTHLLI